MSLPAIAHSERLIVVVGPSGAGKDSVLAGWRERVGAHEVHFARRVITRAPEPSEAHECVDEGEFGRLRGSGELATWWHAHGLLYGVRRAELAALARGGWVVLNGSRAHLGTLRAQAPALHAVEITAPPTLLAQRLAQRAREAPAAMAQRLARHIEVPVALSVCNAGTLSNSVDQLHAWWSQRRAQGAAMICSAMRNARS